MMRALLRLSAALLIVVSFASFADSQTPAVSSGKQTPARDAKTDKPGTGAIKGRVLAADTGRPQGRVRLTLSAATLKEPLHTATDAQGRYAFTDLPAGRYTLEASKLAYVTLKFGQRHAFEAGKPIDLTEGSVLDKVDIVLPRGAVIAGTVVDDLGDAVPQACVTALRSKFERGKRNLVGAGPRVEANDLGQYRLFGLQPGTYFVTTCVSLPRALQGDLPFAPAYYPGTLNPAEAQPVVVGLGQERGGVDVVQPPARLARVSGFVLDSTGRPFSDARFQILSRSLGGNALQAGVKADGSFSVDEIVPGEYEVAAVLRGPGPGDFRQTGFPLTVTGDLEGLVLQLQDGSRVQGRLVTDEGTNPPFRPAGLRVTPIWATSDVPYTIHDPEKQGIVKDDWTFEMNGVGGSALFRTSGLPADYMLKSVLVNGQDITDRPLDIKGSADVSALEMVITSHVTEVAGAPIDAEGHPLLDYSVVVFADEPGLRKYPSRFVATARPDQEGRFKITNLPPGRYLAVALEYLEEGREQDPDYLETLRPPATAFTLTWGETKTLDLKVTKSGGM